MKLINLNPVKIGQHKSQLNTNFLSKSTIKSHTSRHHILGCKSNSCSFIRRVIAELFTIARTWSIAIGAKPRQRSTSLTWFFAPWAWWGERYTSWLHCIWKTSRTWSKPRISICLIWACKSATISAHCSIPEFNSELFSTLVVFEKDIIKLIANHLEFFIEVFVVDFFTNFHIMILNFVTDFFYCIAVIFNFFANIIATLKKTVNFSVILTNLLGKMFYMIFKIIEIAG